MLLFVILSRKGKGARNKQLKLGKRMMMRKMLVLKIHQQERKVMRNLKQMIML